MHGGPDVVTPSSSGSSYAQFVGLLNRRLTDHSLGLCDHSRVLHPRCFRNRISREPWTGAPSRCCRGRRPIAVSAGGCTVLRRTRVRLSHGTLSSHRKEALPGRFAALAEHHVLPRQRSRPCAPTRGCAAASRSTSALLNSCRSSLENSKNEWLCHDASAVMNPQEDAPFQGETL